MAGCSETNKLKLQKEGVDLKTSTANVATLDSEGFMKSVAHLPTTQSMQDGEGTWTNGQVAAATLNAKLPDGVMATIFSPQDVEIAKIQYTPQPAAGEAAFIITGLKATITNPLTVQIEGLKKSVETLAAMDKEARLAQIEEWKAAGTITTEIADLLVQLLPVLIGVPVP